MSADFLDGYLGPIKAAPVLSTRTHAVAMWMTTDGDLMLGCISCRDEHRFSKPLDPDRVVRTVTAFRALHSECGVSK